MLVQPDGGLPPAAAAAAEGGPAGGGGAGGRGGNRSAARDALEALLGNGANLQALLDLPAEADDETLVQLAIALSLQDQVSSA